MKMTLLFVAIALWSMPAVAGNPTDAQVNAAFSKADTDRDGSVSHAEAMKLGVTADALAKADSDKDGTLDENEFLVAITYQFENADPDKDGTLDRKEAMNAGVKSNKIFDSANHDNDGTLDFAEYVHALTMQAE
jgi:Ca2+-binding EF-hand superfamily protein